MTTIFVLLVAWS